MNATPVKLTPGTRVVHRRLKDRLENRAGEVIPAPEGHATPGLAWVLWDRVKGEAGAHQFPASISDLAIEVPKGRRRAGKGGGR